MIDFIGMEYKITEYTNRISKNSLVFCYYHLIILYN